MNETRSLSDQDLQTMLEALPLRRLHSLAKGRIPRHFRMGKRRLIASFLGLQAEVRQYLTAEVTRHMAEQRTAIDAQQISRNRSLPAPATARHKIKSPSKATTARSETPPTTIEAVLEGIGVPPPTEFRPDPWQLEAVSCLSTSDVIVSAPTGSGKTYVAVEAAKRAIEQDQTVIYTSPLKALSNTKYMEFSQIFGADRVGILTGDRRDNAQAPMLIMTTEILRNLLYDAASGEIDVRLNTLGLVILDESQYLADPERGVVWEETIIFCPAQARLLLLSASIGNPDEIAAWLRSIRPVPCHLIHHRERSVPLRACYLHPNGNLTPLFRTRDLVQGRGYAFHPETLKLFAEFEARTFGRGRR